MQETACSTFAAVRNQVRFQESGLKIVPVSEGSDLDLLLEQASRSGRTQTVPAASGDRRESTRRETFSGNRRRCPGIDTELARGLVTIPCKLCFFVPHSRPLQILLLCYWSDPASYFLGMLASTFKYLLFLVILLSSVLKEQPFRKCLLLKPVGVLRQCQLSLLQARRAGQGRLLRLFSLLPSLR